MTILYRRTRAQMPAWAEEVLAADEEGIEIKTLVSPKEIVRGPLARSEACLHVHGDGRIRLQRPSPFGAELEPDYFIECDQVIGASASP